MNSFTRVGLPILLVVGIVFGITYLSKFGSNETPTGDVKHVISGTGGAKELPLNFSVVVASPVPISSTGDMKDVPNAQRHMYFWDATVEVGAPGHFEFWCQNRNPVPTSVRVPTTNCQCAGVELAVVPPDALQEYVIGSALAGGPLGSASGPLAAIAHLTLERRLEWKPLHRDAETIEQTVPAADPVKGPQFALVRLGWKGKGETGPRAISAELFSNGPDGTPIHTPLAANTLVVPAFDLIRREGPDQWKTTHQLSFGELGENSITRLELFMASTTRSYLLYQIEANRSDPCITWSDVMPASEEELASFSRFARSKEEAVTRLKSLYKVIVTVRERSTEVVDGKKTFHQLDLGVLEEKLKVKAVDAGTETVFLRGRVLGDVTILSGAETGKVEMGNAIPSNLGTTRNVVIIADRPGLELSLLEKQTSPSYLKVKLEPLPLVDGRKQWRLRISVPKNAPVGSLPENSGVVLQTNAATPRRFTIPVRGMVFGASGPRL